MTDVGEGFYKYNFTAYDQLKDYTILVDAGDTLSNSDRYHYGSSIAPSPKSIAIEILDNQTAP
jgi:hypothetical protein